MGKIKQISSGEVLDSVIAGEDVYMLKGIREETTVEEIKQAEAYIIIEEMREADAEETAPRQEPETIEPGTACDAESDEPAREPAEEGPDLIENALPPDAPEKYPAKKKKKGKAPSAAQRSNAVDHGKIVACYRAGRSVSWIADEVGCSYPTVVNHLEKEGIYKARK